MISHQLTRRLKGITAMATGRNFSLVCGTCGYHWQHMVDYGKFSISNPLAKFVAVEFKFNASLPSL
jgi:hypothetical protein